MKLYEINEQLEACIDQETGEVLDFDLLNELQVAREEKLEGIACLIKSLKAENKALKEEKSNLDARMKANENKANRLSEYLSYALDGEKFKTSKCSVSYRNASRVECDDEFLEWAKETNHVELFKHKEEFTPDKVTIAKAFKEGIEVPFCHIVEEKHIQIK